MGYTTNFKGAISLSRKLTFSEAKELLEINEDCDLAEKATGGQGIRGYMQWVPSATLDAIVWDEGEKFYDYVKWMEWLCGWLLAKGVAANGDLVWRGEETGDSGVLRVVHNIVTADAGPQGKATRHTPLTLGALGEMALAAVTSQASA